jgi:hypothetical protein
MIDNLELIIPLLKFENKDEFYYLQILQRKKENKELGRNSRVIKNYYINSLEQLKKYYPEIKKLCHVFNARASLRLNRRSFKKVAFKALVNMANTMTDGDYCFLMNSYERACGVCHNEKDKTWIIDIDEYDIKNITQISNTINELNPAGNKIIAKIPSKNGYHLITKPFDVLGFRKFYFDLDIHKDNPTNLYIPLIK